MDNEFKKYTYYTEICSDLKELYKIQIAIIDIQAAKTSAYKLLEKFENFNSSEALNDSLFYPLLLSMVISYARPFSTNRPQGFLDRETYRNKLISELKNLHDNLIRIRNMVYAHTDGTLFRVRYIPHVKIPGLEKNENTNLIIELNPWTDSLPRTDVGNIPALCNEITKTLNEEKQTRLQNCSKVLSNNYVEIRPDGSIHMES